MAIFDQAIFDSAIFDATVPATYAILSSSTIYARSRQTWAAEQRAVTGASAFAALQTGQEAIDRSVESSAAYRNMAISEEAKR